MHCYNSDVDLTGNYFHNNDSYGIYSYTSSFLELYGNVIEENGNHGLKTANGDHVNIGEPYTWAGDTLTGGPLTKASLPAIDTDDFLIDPTLPINPGIVEVKTRLKSPLGRLVLANSITLTPGTLTVETKDDSFFIHWIDVSSQDIESATQKIVRTFEKYLENQSLFLRLLGQAHAFAGSLGHRLFQEHMISLPEAQDRRLKVMNIRHGVDNRVGQLRFLQKLPPARKGVFFRDAEALDEAFPALVVRLRHGHVFKQFRVLFHKDAEHHLAPLSRPQKRYPYRFSFCHNPPRLFKYWSVAL